MAISVGLLWSGGCWAADGLISNAVSIAAYGNTGGYLITSLGEMYQWSNSQSKWIFIGLVSKMRQMDSTSDGTRVYGTTDTNEARKWNMLTGDSAAFDAVQSGKSYDWVVLDPDTDAAKGKLVGLDAWEQWDEQSGGSNWYTYLPAGISGSAEVEQVKLVDKTGSGISRWDRKDVNYRVTLNRAGTTTPFNIYYFGDSETGVLAAVTDPDTAGKNIDDVNVAQISYDEDNKNLWAIDDSGYPWKWDNTNQEWVLANTRGPGSFEDPITDPQLVEAIDYFKTEDDFVVKTQYIDGVYSPVLIIFRNIKTMHLLLGTLSRADFSTVQIIILDGPDPRTQERHNLLLRPSSIPMRYVREDGGRDLVENDYLETLLVNNGVIASADATSILPSRHLRIRI